MATSFDDSEERITTLDHLPINKKAQIVGVEGGYGVRQRLYEMGLTPGVEVIVLSNTGYGPILVHTRGITIALGRGIARKILVEVKD